MTVINDNL